MPDQHADYRHVLHVIVDVPHVVDDYGNEVIEAEVSYRLTCLGVTEECEGLLECDCTAPDADERFEGPDFEDSPLYQAYLDALSAYEDAHPEYGWELSGATDDQPVPPMLEHADWRAEALKCRRIIKALPHCLTPAAMREVHMHLSAGLGDDEAAAEYAELVGWHIGRDEVSADA